MKRVIEKTDDLSLIHIFPLDADGKPIKGIPRHPILEDNVIVYSNATILGRDVYKRQQLQFHNINNPINPNSFIVDFALFIPLSCLLYTSICV